jgi:hypothetical protein
MILKIKYYLDTEKENNSSLSLPNNTNILIDKNMTNFNEKITFSIDYINLPKEYLKIEKGALSIPYVNEGYIVKMPESEKNITLYENLMDIVIKNLILKDNLRVMQTNYYFYLKKFDIIVSINQLFEFTNAGFNLNNNKILILDFIDMVNLI